MLLHIAAAPGPESLAEVLSGGSRADAIELLLSCHARIRHFTELSLRLSRAEASAAELDAAAARVHRYYSEALPLHEADENESLYPRLRGVLETTLAAANEAIVRQHAAIDAHIAALRPLWRRGAAAPRAELEARTLALRAAWDEHLELEETVVLPGARAHLAAAELEAIRAEMVARRRP